MKKLAIITTHPIQYNAPLFQLLSQRNRIQVKIFYTWSQAQKEVYDPGFGQTRTWDIPLLEGYEYTFVENTASRPGSHHFRGIRNPTLVQEIQQWQADAILVFGWSFFSHLKCMRYFKNKIPVLFRGDSTLLDEQPGVKTALRRLLLRWIYRSVDKVLFVGINNRAYYLAHGVTEDQLVYAPHAIDNQRFGDKNGRAEWKLTREALGLDSNAFVVLFAGKLEEKKDPFFLLTLAGKLKQPDIRFVLVGNGPLEETLKEKAAHDKRIYFLPFQNQSQMPAVYRLANVFILPSKGPGETWGLAANEAMASGIPVVLSEKVGGAADLVCDDLNGLVFKRNDSETVVSFLSSLYCNREKLVRANQAARAQVQHFSFQKIAEAIEGAVG